MKKAQMITQVVILILAAFIFILILTYGYKAIQNLSAKQEKVSLIEFQKSAEATFKRVKQNYGSIEKYNMQLPGFEEVCIVSSKQTAATQLKTNRPLLHSAWETGAANVFVMPDGPQFQIPNVQVPGSYCCIQLDAGRATWKLKGMGTHTEATSWEEGGCQP